MSRVNLFVIGIFCLVAIIEGQIEGPTSDADELHAEQPPMSFDDQYEEATNTYQAGEYEKSIKMWKSVVVNYMMLQHATSQCARKCKSANISIELKMNFTGFPYLETFGNQLAYGECFKTCMEGHPYRKVSAKPLPSLETLEELERRVPYNYLQFAYYKTEQYKKCCEAVTTYLQRNPYDEAMGNNMKFYSTLPQVKDHFFRDLEAPKFHKTYRTGVEAYEDGDHKQAIVEIEEALVGFMDAFDECELMCEKPYEQTYFHRITKEAAVEEVRKLRCVTECEFTISPIIQDWKVQNFTSRCFQFLQFAYFQVGETSSAVSCATSSFLLNPDADLSRQNVEFYQGFLKKKGFMASEIQALLTPRKDALAFYNRVKDVKSRIAAAEATFTDVYDDEGSFDEADVPEAAADDDVLNKEDLFKSITSSIENGLNINI